MPLKELQKQVDDWTSQFTPQYWPPFEIMTQLQEESGELAREVTHEHGHKKKKEGEVPAELGEEIADVLFPLICLANSQGIDLDKYWDKMIQERLYKRDKDRFQKVSKL